MYQEYLCCVWFEEEKQGMIPSKHQFVTQLSKYKELNTDVTSALHSQSRESGIHNMLQIWLITLRKVTKEYWHGMGKKLAWKGSNQKWNSGQTETMTHTWYEKPNPLKKVVIASESDFRIWSWTVWKRMTGENPLAHTVWVLLYSGLHCQGPGCTDWPQRPCPASPGTATHNPCPRPQRLHFSSALSLQSLPELCCSCVCLQLCLSQGSTWPWTLLIPSTWTDILARPRTSLVTMDPLGSPWESWAGLLKQTFKESLIRSKQRNVEDANMPLYICLYESQSILIQDLL